MIELVRRLLQRRRSQGGFVLSTVIAVLFLFTLVGVALLALVVASLRLSRAGINSSDQKRAIDGAMETGLQQVRGAASDCAGLALSQQGLSVSCSVKSTTTGAAADRRVVDLSVKKGSTSVGQARVRIVDLVVAPGDPGDPSTRLLVDGFSVEVCDWRLGAGQASGELRGCPT